MSAITQPPSPSRPRAGLPPSTVHAVLRRHGMHRLAWLDRPTGRLVRRYERTRPGELVHVDVEKLGAIRPGGGWWAHGHGSAAQLHTRTKYRAGRRVGYDYVHCAIDDHTRTAHAEIHPDETATTCADFLRAAAAWFARHGIGRIERVMTDNAKAYRSATPGGRLWPTSARCPGSPALTGPRPTALRSSSTALWPTNGPTCAPSTAQPNEPPPCPIGCTPTTITAPTGHSADTRRSAGSPSATVLVTTLSGPPGDTSLARWNSGHGRTAARRGGGRCGLGP
jgi:hypothetical protein